MSTIGLVFLLTTTDPTHLSSALLLIPFCLFFLILWCLIFLILGSTASRQLRAARSAFVFAGLPVGLLLLQSIGQLTPWDIVTVIAFAILAYFYLVKIATKNQAE